MNRGTGVLNGFEGWGLYNDDDDDDDAAVPVMCLMLRVLEERLEESQLPWKRVATQPR